MDNKLITGIIGVVVVVALLGSALVPVIDGLAGGVEYEDNPDWDGWVRFDLNTSADAAYHLEMSQDDNGIYVENLTSDSRDIQIYDDSTTVEYPTIMYADSNTVVWSDDDTFNVMGKINGSPVFVNAPILDITRDSNGVEVVTDTESYLFDAPTWAYVPLSQGKYGFYPYNEDRGVEHPANAPIAVLGGGFAGVYAYNDIYRYNGLGLHMHPVYDDDGLFYGAYWDQTAPVEPESLTPDVFDPSVIDFDPSIIDLDPITLDPGAQLMSVPTPDYTDGDWGYNLFGSNATIVSYSGTVNGELVVPSTVGGYHVETVGKSVSSSMPIMENSQITPGSSLVISEGIWSVNCGAFRSLSNFTGTLTLPSSVQVIRQVAFSGSGFTGTLTLPPNLTTIQNCFDGCSGFTSVIIPDSLTSIPSGIFSGCTGLTSVKFPDGLTSVGSTAFQGCSGLNGTLVIPSSVTSLGNNAFRNTGYSGLVISSDATPGGTGTFQISSLTEVLDLSEIDYSVDRYGIPVTATVSESIGDCFGFVSIVTIERGSSGALGGAAALLYAIPVVIIAAMLVAGAGWIISKRY